MDTSFFYTIPYSYSDLGSPLPESNGLTRKSQNNQEEFDVPVLPSRDRDPEQIPPPRGLDPTPHAHFEGQVEV